MLIEEITKSDIVITLPATVDWDDYQRELDAVEDYSQVMRFKVNHLPKKDIIGSKCYLVYKGNMIGWMEITGVHSGSFVCSTTGKYWVGNFVERSGPFHRINPTPYKGFQGWRYI